MSDRFVVAWRSWVAFTPVELMRGHFAASTGDRSPRKASSVYIWPSSKSHSGKKESSGVTSSRDCKCRQGPPLERSRIVMAVLAKRSWSQNHPPLRPRRKNAQYGYHKLYHTSRRVLSRVLSTIELCKLNALLNIWRNFAPALIAVCDLKIEIYIVIKLLRMWTWLETLRHGFSAWFVGLPSRGCLWLTSEAHKQGRRIPASSVLNTLFSQSLLYHWYISGHHNICYSINN